MKDVNSAEKKKQDLQRNLLCLCYLNNGVYHCKRSRTSFQENFLYMNGQIDCMEKVSSRFEQKLFLPEPSEESFPEKSEVFISIVDPGASRSEKKSFT